MGAGHVAGRAGVADRLTGAHALTGGGDDAALVAVPDLGAVVEGDDGAVAVGARVARVGHRTGRDRDDRRARRAREVEAGVHTGPQRAGLAEPRGQRVAGDRQHPLVRLVLIGDVLRLVAQLAVDLQLLRGLLLGLAGQRRLVDLGRHVDALGAGVARRDRLVAGVERALVGTRGQRCCADPGHHEGDGTRGSRRETQAGLATAGTDSRPTAADGVARRLLPDVESTFGRR